MIKLNQLVIKIFTIDDKVFSAKKVFHDGINVVGSINNTKGKSSFLQGIYYCLGIEELIGGKKETALSPIFKTRVVDEQGINHDVYRTYFYLEIENNNGDIYTIERCAQNKDRDSNLIMVAKGKYNDFDRNFHTPYYVHLSGSYELSKGFHKWLSKFIGLESLPKVPNSNGGETKLYLQLILAPFFIEQKSGWTNYLNNIPYYSIVEAKKRVLEFILNLSKTNDNKKIELLKIEEKQLNSKIEELISTIKEIFKNDEVIIHNIDNFYKNVYTPEWKNSIRINYSVNNKLYELLDYISLLEEKIANIDVENYSLKNNLSDLQKKIEENQKAEAKLRRIIESNYSRIELIKAELVLEQDSQKKLLFEITNLTEILKLKNLGSNIDNFIITNKCPTCKQSLELENIDDIELLNLEGTINHYKAQLDLIEFAIQSNQKELKELDSSIQKDNVKLKELQSLLQAQISDVFKPSESLSYSLLKEKVNLENKIESLNLNNQTFNKCLDTLNDYFYSLDSVKKQIQSVEKKLASSIDDEKIKYFTTCFKDNLKLFGYTSVDIRNIYISEKTLCPVSFECDLRLASSASDNIRSMWAYYLSLQQTCIRFKDSKSVYFFLLDDPVQQSAKREDFYKFLQEMQKLKSTQFILGVTIDEKVEEEELPIISNYDANALIKKTYIFEEEK